MSRLDTLAAQRALRLRLLTLTVVSTGETALGATTTGYTRSAGSFVDDGFLPGMEVTPAGFPFSTPAVITAVTASQLTTRTALAVAAEAPGRTLSVGVPHARGFEMRAFAPPPDLAPYLEEEYVPRPPFRRTAPADGAVLDEFGLWVVRWYGLPGYDVGAIRRCVDAVLALYPPGLTIPAGAHALRVQGGPTTPGPWAGQISRTGSHAMCPITIPVWTQSTIEVAS
jgi:hypothetical protein